MKKFIITLFNKIKYKIIYWKFLFKIKKKTVSWKTAKIIAGMSLALYCISKTMKFAALQIPPIPEKQIGGVVKMHKTVKNSEIVNLPEESPIISPHIAKQIAKSIGKKSITTNIFINRKKIKWRNFSDNKFTNIHIGKDYKENK